MTVELIEEEMRRALFGAARATVPQVPIPDPMAHIPDVVILPPAPAAAARKKKASRAFIPRLRVTLQVGNVFEGAPQVYAYEADTLSTLLAEQEAVKVARKKIPVRPGRVDRVDVRDVHRKNLLRPAVLRL